MENQTLKDLIDKLLIDDFDNEELRVLSEKIAGNQELIDYYQRTLKLKDELSKLAEQEPFTEEEIVNARNQLYAEINKKTPVYKLWHMAVAAIVSAGLTSLAILSFAPTSKPALTSDANLMNVSVEQIDNDNFQITGKEISDFRIKGGINDPQIQRLLLKTINQSNNLGSRINAINYLTRSQNQKILTTFLDIAVNDPSIALRLKAIESLQNHLNNESVQKGLIQIIQTDSNDIVRIAAFNQLNNLPLTSDTKPVFKEFFEKNTNEYIRQTALKRIIKGEI